MASLLLRLSVSALVLSAAVAKPDRCRGNSDGLRDRGRYVDGSSHNIAEQEQDRPKSEGYQRKPSSLLNAEASNAAKPLLDARAERLWMRFNDFATDTHKRKWAQAGHNATDKLALAFGLVAEAVEAASGDDSTAAKVAESVWQALPATDRSQHGAAWTAYKSHTTLSSAHQQLALALGVMRSPAVNARGDKGWLTAEEMKGIYEADLKAATEAWEAEGEEAPTTDEATRLLLGCVAIASSLNDCEVQIEWARKCHECEQESKWHEQERRHPPWLIAIKGVSAVLLLLVAVCVCCGFRKILKRKAAACKLKRELKNAEALVLAEESKLKAMTVAEKQVKLPVIDGAKVDMKVDVEECCSA